MSARFIIGRAGSGKTRHCLEGILDDLAHGPGGPQLVLLTPQQATFQMEREIAGRSPGGAFSRAHVLSLRRLAHRVFLEVGGSAAPELEPLGKTLLLRDILWRLEDRLQVFGATEARRGIASRLAATLSELEAYEITPETLRETVRESTDVPSQRSLRLKVEDLALIAEYYREALASAYTDPESVLSTFAERCAESSFLNGARIWVDGFAFTPLEARALSAAAACAAETEIALMMDPEEVPADAAEITPESLFHTTGIAYLRLRDQLRKDGVDIQPTIKLQSVPVPRFEGTPALAALERSIFQRLDPSEVEPEGIVVLEADDPETEVAAAAREILRLVRDEDYRYRDTAIIVRSLEAYHRILPGVLRRHEIPFFLDRRREVANHPLIELIRSCTRVLSGKWASGDVIRYLKTGFTTLDPDAVDRLENYALANGVRHSEWRSKDSWSRWGKPRFDDDRPLSDELQEDLRLLDEWRRTGLTDLEACHEGLTALEGFPESISPREVSAALLDLLRAVGAREKVQEWIDGALTDRDDPEEAALHRQVWEQVMGVLEQLLDVIGDRPVSFAEYVDLLDEGLDAIRLGLVPPTLDAVLIGEVERSRHPDLSAVFLLGMSEGLFPRKPGEDPILTEVERLALEEGGLRLRPGAETRLYQERFLAYVAMTRPRERLWISHSIADAAGVRQQPSPFLRDLRGVFPGLQVKSARRIGAATPAPEHICTLDQLAHALSFAFQDDKEADKRDFWLSLYNWAVQDPDRKALVARVLRGLWYDNRATLSQGLVKQRWSGSPTISVTKLQDFAACPFRFFAGAVLSLQPRQEPKVMPVDLGSLHHAVLDRLVREVKTRHTDWQALSEKEIRRLAGEAVEEVLSGPVETFYGQAGRDRHLLARARRSAFELARVLVGSLRHSRFSPWLAEEAFGEKGKFPPVEARLDDGRTLGLRGRIDRVDRAQNLDVTYFRVLDYKSSLFSTGYRVVRRRHGLDLQLPVYMLAVREGMLREEREAEPAGGFLMPLRRNTAWSDLGPDCDPAENPDREIKEHRMRGMFPESTADFHEAGPGRKSTVSTSRADRMEDEDFHEMLENTWDILEGLARRLLDGEIRVWPARIRRWRPCEYCDYRSVCRFDPAIQGYHDLSESDDDDDGGDRV